MRDPDLLVWVEDDGEWCDCVNCSGQLEFPRFTEICDRVERNKEGELFTRITRITQTDEGLQQANISVYLYDNEDIAYTYFKDFMSDSEWEMQLLFGEGFYKVEANGYTNTIFLETKQVPDNSKL